jgi:hypothetical protein
MSDDKQIPFVLNHAIVRICMHVATVDDWQQVRPDQFRLIERRLKQARVHPDDRAAIVSEANKLANPRGTMPDDELMQVLRSPVLRMLLSIGSASDTTWRRGARQLQLTPAELDFIRNKLGEVFDESSARHKPRH